jgi:PAT family beta-lactamase induction signal transducer AmpG
LLDAYWTKRAWVLLTQALMAFALGACALVLQTPNPYWPMLGLLALLALTGSAHDICVDGLYLTSLDPKAQARWIGWQGAFWTTGRIFSASVLVGVASALQGRGVAPRQAWQAAFAVAATCLAAISVYHRWSLPNLQPSRPAVTSKRNLMLTSLVEPWRDFFRRPQIWGMLMFVMFFRFAEGFLTMETPLFMQSGVSQGGLGMCATTALTADCPHWLSQRALIDGFLSTSLSVVFGILGGRFAARVGLTNRLLLVMATCINLPILVLVYLSHAAGHGEPVPLGVIATLISIEKAGYSFGFVANMLYMLQVIAPGKYPMTHLALCTALMNAAIVPTQAISGHLAQSLGYASYFLFVCSMALPSLLVAWKAPLGGGAALGGGATLGGGAASRQGAELPAD